MHNIFGPETSKFCLEISGLPLVSIREENYYDFFSSVTGDENKPNAVGMIGIGNTAV